MFFTKPTKESVVQETFSTPFVPTKRIPVFEEKYKEAVAEALLKFKLAVIDHLEEWVVDENAGQSGSTFYTYSIGINEIFRVVRDRRYVVISCKEHGLYSYHVDRETGKPENAEDREIDSLVVMIQEAINFKQTEGRFVKALADLNSILETI